MKKILLILTFLIVSCGGNDNNINPIRTVDKVEECPQSCKKLNQLGCAEGKDLIYPQTCDNKSKCEVGSCIDGKCIDTCISFCEYMINNGATLDVKCWQTIKSCEEINTICRQPV